MGVTLASFQNAAVPRQVEASAVEEMYARCMRGGSTRGLIKGGLMYQYMISPFFVWCDRFAPATEKDPLNPYMDMIFQKGRTHEDEIIRDHFPGTLEIDPTKHEAAFRQTLEAMFRGEQYIGNGILYYIPHGLVAVPDVLVKVPGKSIFGDWTYHVVEIKSSSQIRDEHIMQAAYYTYLVGFLQEYTPEKFTMVDGHKEHEEYPFSDYSAKVQDTLADIRAIFQGKPIEPARIGWPWESYSIKRLQEQKSISLIPGMFSTHREALETAGVKTLDDFFQLKILRVKGISFDTMDRYRRHAKAILQGRHTFLEKPFLPEGKAELYVDLEGIEPVEIDGKKVGGDYLIGVLLRENGIEQYTAFVGVPGQEHRMVIDFLKFVRAHPGIIYHYGSYEKSHLAKLLHATGIEQPLIRELLEGMVDLLPVVRKYVIFPTTSYTLKEIGRYLGYQWQGIADAKDSIVLYIDYLKTGKKELLDKIILYNQDDCAALRRVKDFLVWGT